MTVLDATGILANVAVVAGAIWAVVAFGRGQRSAEAERKSRELREDREWDARLLAKASEALTKYLLYDPARRQAEQVDLSGMVGPDPTNLELIALVERIEHIAWQFRVIRDVGHTVQQWIKDKNVYALALEGQQDTDGASMLRTAMQEAFPRLNPQKE